MKTLLGRFTMWREAPSSPRSTQTSEMDRYGTHREIVAMALRDVLRKFGIPATWITANPQVSTTAKRERGLHLHLMVRDWHPQMLVYLVAIERQVRARALRLDPFSSEWLTGISWKFDLVDENSCPALPDAGFWRDYLRAPAAPSVKGIDPPSNALLQGRRRAPEREPGFMPTQPMAR